jgi:localization factor PodJL
LSRSLSEARAQNSADADRIARAVQEVLAASTRTQDAPARFEKAARWTLEELGHTVVDTASRAAVLAAGHAAEAVQRSGGVSGIERLESELRALNQQSRESAGRNEAALNRMHSTLRDFLDLGRDAGMAEPPKKRANIHDPISGNSAIYQRAATGFGAAPASAPRLDTLLVREPRPSDPGLLEALRDAGERLATRKSTSPVQDHLTDRGEPAALLAAGPQEEYRTVPLSGIAVIAFILLLVSGALLYLHNASRMMPVRLSGEPAAQTAPAQAQPAALRDGPAPSRPEQALRQPLANRGHPLLLAAAGEADSAGGDLKTLEAAARQGDREAQFRIGQRFLNDSSLDGGAAAAARWLTRAAGQGHIEAQFMLASLFERGAGVTRNESEAIGWYRQAAAAGHVRAMHNLGVLLSARASPQDYREAASWFNQAALAGLPGSQYNLAALYEHGLGIEQDLYRAYQWYQSAAKAGDREAAKQAERLKHTMPAADTSATAGQAQSWMPMLEDSVHSARRGSARG